MADSRTMDRLRDIMTIVRVTVRPGDIMITRDRAMTALRGITIIPGRGMALPRDITIAGSRGMAAPRDIMITPDRDMAAPRGIMIISSRDITELPRAMTASRDTACLRDIMAVPRGRKREIEKRKRSGAK